MGAAITQRPTCFGGAVRLSAARHAALPEVSGGSYWVTEYGSSDNEKQFPYLLKYSPYQNVKAATAYRRPVLHGDSDTRVAPLHARKMSALLQSASSSGRPVLLHYSVAGGHSQG